MIGQGVIRNCLKEGNQLTDFQTIGNGIFLKENSDLIFGLTCLSFNEDLTTARFFITKNTGHQDSLTRPIRSNQGYTIALVYLKTNIL